MRKGLSAVFILIVLIAGCESRQESIKVSGAFALYPLMVKWADEYQKLHPGVRIEVSAGGAGKGMSDALSGLVEIGMISRDIDQSEVDKGAFYVAVAKDAVVPTANRNNPLAQELKGRGLTKAEFKEVFVIGNRTRWGSLVGADAADDRISLYTRADSCGAADIWAKFMGAKQEDLKGIGVNADPGIADAVSRDRNGMGYNNIGFAYDEKTGKPMGDLMILPIDINGDGRVSEDESFYDDRQSILDAILAGKYPSPPARDLYIATKGNFSGSAGEFVRWMLTDGQQYVPEAGYIPLAKDRLQEQVRKLG
ncbi:MAG: substrate-binding domain-containing protein [Candidatus Altiarchaeota archaeon]